MCKKRGDQLGSMLPLPVRLVLSKLSMHQVGRASRDTILELRYYFYSTFPSSSAGKGGEQRK